MKDILISLCGTSPAVVTEAIWALFKEDVVLSEVVVITTTEGHKTITNQLFGDDKILEQLRRSLPTEYSGFKFSDSSRYIKLLPNANDTGESEDLQHTDDTLQVGDFMLNVLRTYTEKSDTKIHFSIAGGRKSMTAMGALTMSLIGREQDQLCHILVDDRLVFAQPKFYFPSKTIHVHTDQTTRVETKLEGESAKVTLSKIPYVRMRHLFKDKFGVPEYYQELIEAANKAAKGDDRYCLEIRVKEQKVFIDGKEVKLTDRPFAYLYAFARHGKVIKKGKYTAAEETQDVIDKYSSDLGVNISSLISSASLGSIPGAISDLRNKLKPYTILTDKRAQYGLDYDKVEVKII
jgi:CRISPR-associated protein (TIGR02584 family)